MKTTLLILFLGICTIQAQVDSLFSARLSEPYEIRFAKSVVNNIPKKVSTKDLERIKKFCKENKRYGYLVLDIIVKNDSKVMRYLDSIEWSHKYWVEFAYSVDSTVLFRNQDVETFIFKNLQKSDFDYRDIFYLIFSKNGSFKQCENLINTFRFDLDYDSHGSFFKTQARFKSTKTDSIINLELRECKSLKHLELLLRKPLKKYNRYDFLLQLKKLPKRVEELRTPDNSRYADKILKELKTLIPYLEQKKKENAPIGLPLDWGMVKE